MSDNVDKRVVQMEFDNSKFDKNVKQSSSTLDEFKKNLDFKDTCKSLEAVAKKFSMFSAIAFSVLNNLTNRVVDFGIQMVKSLSIDQVSSGWDKFGQKTTSVATLAAQKIKIAGREIEQGSQEAMDAINEQLEKLNWFTDETSYNFTDMVNTIGKFTAAGQDLDKSVRAMMGIANWAALSGQNAAVASRAMEQLAQTLGRGYVQLQDWRSIQNANMDTQEFRQTVLETAAAMGELTKIGNEFVSKTGKKITATNFADTLSDKWFTSDIMIKSLEKYSAAVEKVYEIAEETGLTASEVMKRYGSELDEFGLKAFKAAQEARTLGDAINSVKDAVSTGWMNTAERIFGGYNESKELWTDLANELYDVFAEGGNFRNEILGIWKDLGGRADLFKHDPEHPEKQGAFWNIFDSVVAVKNLIKEAWNIIFPKTAFTSESEQVKDLANNFKNFTTRIQEFTARMVSNIKENEKFLNICKGIFSVIKIIITAAKGLWFAISPIVDVIKGVISDLFDRMALFGNNLSKVEGIAETIEKVSRKIANVLSKIIEIINPRGILDKVFAFIGKIVNSIKELGVIKGAGKGIGAIFESIGDGLSSLKDKLHISDISDLSNPIVSLLSGVVSFVKGLISFLKPLLGVLGIILQQIGKLLTGIGNAISNFVNKNAKSSGGMVSNLLKLVLILTPLAVIGVAIYNIIWTIKTWLAPLQALAEGLSEMFFGLAQKFKMGAYAKIIESIAVALIAFTIAMHTISQIPTNDLSKAMAIIIIFATLLMGMVTHINKLAGASDSLSKTIKKSRIQKNLGNTALKLSLALLAVAGAFSIISNVPWEGMLKGLAVIAMMVAAITGLSVLMKAKIVDPTKLTGLFTVMLIAVPAILAFAGALAILSLVDITTLGKGLLALAATLVSFAALSKILSSALVPMLALSGVMIIVAVGMTAMSAALLALAGVLAAFSVALRMLQEIKWETIGKAAAIMGGLIVIMVALLAIAAAAKPFVIDLIALTLAIDLLAASMLLFAVALSALSLVSWPTIGKGAIIVAGGFVVLGAAAMLLKPVVGTIVALAAAFMLVGAGLLLAATAMTIFSSGIAVFALAMSENATLIGDALKAMGPVLVDALIDSFSHMLDSVSQIIPKITEIVINLINGLIEILYTTGPELTKAALGVIVELLQAIANNIHEIASSLLDILIGVIEVLTNNMGRIVKALVEFIVALVRELAIQLGPRLDEILGYIVSFILDLIGALTKYVIILAGAMTKVLLILIHFMLKLALISLGALAADLIAFIGGLILLVVQVIEGLSNVIYEALKYIFVVVIKLLSKVFRELAPMLVIAGEILGMSLASGILRALSDSTIGDILDFLGIHIGKVADDLDAQIDKQIGKLEQYGSASGVKKAIQDATTEIMDTVSDVTSFMEDVTESSLDMINDSTEKAMGQLGDTMAQAGQQVMSGFTKGVDNSQDDVTDTMNDFVDNATNTTTDGFDINSPSKVFARIGSFVIQGFNKGISNELPSAENTIKKSFNDIISKTQQILDSSDIDDEIVIKPVMDLSGVRDGANNIADLMSSISGRSVSLSGNLATKTSTEISRSKAISENQNSGSQTTINNGGDVYNATFNVTTNDPEELARQADIIMQRERFKTKWAKGRG